MAAGVEDSSKFWKLQLLVPTGCAKGLNRSGSAVENEKAPEPMEQLMNTWIEMSQISHKGT